MPERYAPSAAENYATSVLLSTLRAIKTAMARTPVDQWPWHSTVSNYTRLRHKTVARGDR